MRYALNLADDGRVLSVTYEKYAPINAVIVESFPDGDVYNYRYVDGNFIYDPITEPPEPEITTDDILNALLGVTE